MWPIKQLCSCKPISGWDDVKMLIATVEELSTFWHWVVLTPV